MAWNNAAETTPPEGEQILIYDDRHNRIEFGRWVNQKWYIESPDAELLETTGVARWAWILDAELNGDDD